MPRGRERARSERGNEMVMSAGTDGSVYFGGTVQEIAAIVAELQGRQENVMQIKINPDQVAKAMREAIRDLSGDTES